VCLQHSGDEKKIDPVEWYCLCIHPII